ncbi:hypothetical protein PIIN_09836 [Serendipita indica DSM 11827]|uniref:Uncharacterized protein n=1 Tax=Serendipita indica (strain DSM 11827) TaxID=1109443 RepID=G4TX05_SERID|nr:hypothetical protein PIIN_09836 [Serendipita indica DSM 11827]
MSARSWMNLPLRVGSDSPATYLNMCSHTSVGIRSNRLVCPLNEGVADMDSTCVCIPAPNGKRIHRDQPEVDQSSPYIGGFELEPLVQHTRSCLLERSTSNLRSHAQPLEDYNVPTSA